MNGWFQAPCDSFYVARPVLSGEIWMGEDSNHSMREGVGVSLAEQGRWSASSGGMTLQVCFQDWHEAKTWRMYKLMYKTPSLCQKFVQF